jgi:hypothetical protein
MRKVNPEFEKIFSNIMNNQLSQENSENNTETDNMMTKDDFFMMTNSSNLHIRNKDFFNFKLQNTSIDPFENFENLSMRDSIYDIENSDSKEKKQIFKTVKSSNQLIKKKRGRNRMRKQNEKFHDKKSSDNVLRKIQVHYLSFIIDFLNNILSIFNYNRQFLKLDYNFKKNVNRKHINKLKKNTLEEIVCNNISSKFKKYKTNENKLLCEEVKENPVLKRILSENYCRFFRKIYYPSKNPMNLNEYGLTKKVILFKKIQMYKDLLEKSGALKDNILKRSMDDCLLQHFLPKWVFFLH